MGLAGALGQVLPIEVEEDGALTMRHDGTFASIRTLPVAEGLEIIALTQLLAWDLACDDELRRRVADQAAGTMFGTVTMVEDADGRAEVMLRYNFPAGGLDERALQTLILMVLTGGAETARVLAQPR
jgi:hypothetical protein